MDESVKHQQTKQFSSFLKVFELILRGISNWTNNEKRMEPETVTNEENDESDEEERMLCEDWINVLLSDDTIQAEEDTPHKEDEEEEIKHEVEDDDNANLDNEDPFETKPELPKHIEMTRNILQQILKYIASKKRAEKLIALETCSIGLKILKPYENELLPLVHLIWYPFVERLSDKDPVILRRCFDLLIVLGQVAKDFITSRTSK